MRLEWEEFGQESSCLGPLGWGSIGIESEACVSFGVALGGRPAVFYRASRSAFERQRPPSSVSNEPLYLQAMLGPKGMQKRLAGRRKWIKIRQRFGSDFALFMPPPPLSLSAAARLSSSWLLAARLFTIDQQASPPARWQDGRLEGWPERASRKTAPCLLGLGARL